MIGVSSFDINGLKYFPDILTSIVRPSWIILGNEYKNI